MFLFFNSCLLSNLLSQNLFLGFQGGLDKTNIHVARNTMYHNEKQIYQSILSFNINGYVGYRSKSFWGLSFEPGFIQKGGNIVQETMYDPYDQKHVLNYIQLPILFDLYFSKHLYLSIGPEFAYLIKAQIEYSRYTKNAYDLYNKFEISGAVGLWYSIFNNLDIGLKFNSCLFNPTKLNWIDDYGNFTGQTTEYNQYFQLTIRVKK